MERQRRSRRLINKRCTMKQQLKDAVEGERRQRKEQILAVKREMREMKQEAARREEALTRRLIAVEREMRLKSRVAARREEDLTRRLIAVEDALEQERANQQSLADRMLDIDEVQTNRMRRIERYQRRRHDEIRRLTDLSEAVAVTVNFNAGVLNNFTENTERDILEHEDMLSRLEQAEIARQVAEAQRQQEENAVRNDVEE